MRRRSVVALLCAGALVAGEVTVGFTQQAEEYVAERITLQSGAHRMTSASYETTLTVGQPAPVGAIAVCGPGPVGSFGFWSIRGDLPVPIDLRVSRNATDPVAIDLVWTGAEGQYQVCRGFRPQDVCATPYSYPLVCRDTDTRAFESDVIFYLVTPRP